MTRSIKFVLKEFVVPECSWKIVILNNWESIIGNLKNRVSIQTIFDDHLVLGVTHPGLAQELLFLAPLIKEKINLLIKQDRIKKIGFRVIQSKKPELNGFVHQDNYENCLKKEEGTLYALTIQQSVTLALCKDPELKASCEKFFIRCLQQGAAHEKKKKNC